MYFCNPWKLDCDTLYFTTLDSHHVRVGLRDGLLRANKDSSVESIVIYGGKTFLAGADIKEFSSGAAAQGKFTANIYIQL